MLDEKTLEKIVCIGEKCKRRRNSKLLRRALSELSEIRKKAYGKDGIDESFKESDTAKWLYENFPRLEQTLKESVGILKKTKLLSGEDRESVFYKAFAFALDKKERLSDGEIKDIFKYCNQHAKNATLEDSMSFLPLIKLCVCMKICRLFCEAYEQKERDNTPKIRDLFFTLDELDFVNADAVFDGNETEEILLSDPMKIYSCLTPKTKAVYRKNLIKLSKKHRVSQSDTARHVVGLCRKNKGEDRHIGKYLCDKPQGGKTYMFLVFFMTAVFTLLLCLISPVFIISVFSVYGCARLLADKFFVRFFVKSFHLPEIELDKVPDGHGVMVVITSLLTGTRKDDELFERLELMYRSNGGENVYFGLLCDLGDSDEEYRKEDEKTVSEAVEKILSLRKKYGNKFFLFLRQREYSESEKRYTAPERKRGAVNALVCFLCGKSDGFCMESIRPDEKICRNVKYVFTLDADTNLAFDCLKRMTGIMMHPQNIPFVDKEKNAVTRGYGLLQPATNPTLESSRKSFFSAVMCGHGGVDLYSSGGSDTLMSMFGRSIFCGKGMFEKNCFCRTLCGDKEFRKEWVLSHDAPEGARLRCAFVPDITLTDSFPSEALSYYKRQHRWIRGDIQNIPFLLKSVQTADGGKIKNGIGSASRFFIWHNVYSALLPVFTLFTLFASLFCERDIAALLVGASLAVYVLPFGYSVLSGAKRAIFHNFRRLYFSEWIYTGIWTSFFKMLFTLCAIPKSAAVSLDAVVRSCVRCLVSHKYMLEWTTAAQNDAEKKDGLLGYVKKNLINALCGALLFVLSPTGILKLLGLLWFFMPVFAYHSARSKDVKKRHLDKSTKHTLEEYCADMWKFFSQNVSEKTNHLPTDNISLYPKRKMSHMTSPTNIGLYLLSVLCASKLGFADRSEVFSRIQSCLGSIDRLEKHKGLMYNWYDIFKAKPLEPRYISSVDIGNLAACLVCVKEGIKNMYPEFFETDRIYSLCTKLLWEIDYSLLFDSTSKLFYIGAKEKDGTLIFDRNRYDMLISEARILSFCAVAERKVTTKHLSHLSRIFVEGKGYMGLASWSGTAFEYFMPEIFMPSKKGSLVYEALCFSYFNMRKSGVGFGKDYVFGISESCYNELDELSNYKYFAFGVPEIAVNVFGKENVISPYSSFLFMKMRAKEVIKNLERLRKLGAYGEYGFYESVDFERPNENEGYGIVRCFMSHHIGMSIAALTNYLFDGIVSKWFGADITMKSALELTEEKIPYDAYVKKRARRHYVQNIKPATVAKKESVPDVNESIDKKETKSAEILCGEKNHYLMSSDRFSALVGENSLGTSFVRDMNTPVSKMQGEKLLLDDGFDLCKNSNRMFFGKNKAVYEGMYGERRYKVEVIMPCGMPCKIITVSGLCSFISLDILPSEKCDGERHIGAGLVFFGEPKENEKGFAFGICRKDKCLAGAEYFVSDGVRIRVFVERGAQAVFCIGKADEDAAAGVYDDVRNDLDGILERTENFTKSIAIKQEYVDTKLLEAVGKHFAYPADNSCSRVFVKSRGNLHLYDTLLLMYTDYPRKREILIKAFDKDTVSDIEKLLLCLAFSEYERLMGDRSVIEFKIKGETLYKRCLAYLGTLPENGLYTDLYVEALSRFSMLCTRLGDTRTGIFLDGRIKKIFDKSGGGIFL